MTLVTVVGLTALTVVFKGLASLLPRVPDQLVQRTTLLAPALLAALVVTELVDGHGIPHLDAKAAAVAVAIALAWRRAPLAVCVLAGAVVAATLRAV